MKNINELTPSDCQIILNKIFEEDKMKFSSFITIDNEIKGIVYNIDYETTTKNFPLYFSEPDVIIELYNLQYDIKNILMSLKIDYLEMDEINYTFFDHITMIGDILYDNKIDNNKKIEKITELRKSLADKI